MTVRRDSQSVDPTPAWVNVGFQHVSLGEVAATLGARLHDLGDSTAAIIDLTAVFLSDDAGPVGAEIKKVLDVAAGRGVILVIAATDEAVRLELIRCNVDRVAPVRGDHGDAQAIINRMISI